MRSDQIIFIKPHYAFAVSYFLAVFNAIGVIDLPWLVVVLPLLISVSPVLLFAAAIVSIIGFITMVAVGAGISDYFDGE